MSDFAPVCPLRSPIQPATPSSAPTQAVVLVGGRGKRLGDRTADTPKPLLPVGGRPFLDHLLAEITRHGLEEVLLLCGYRSAAVAARYDGARCNGARIRCLSEQSPLGTGGALAHARSEGALAARAYVLNGDSLFDINLHDLARTAARARTPAAIALRPIADSGRYGRVRLDGDRVTAWAEKRGGGEGLINGGVYLLDAALLDDLPQGVSALEEELFPLLAGRGALAGMVSDRFFIDIGVPADLARAQTAVPAARTRPAAFLDRDGTLNVDHGYVHTPDAIDWTPGAKAAVKLLNDSGYLVVLVTNQAGVAHGYYATSAVDELHAWMQRELIAAGAHLDAVYYCPHHPEGTVTHHARACLCRKPSAGMIQAALVDWPIDPARSLLIGDRDSDLAAAAAAGVSGYRYDGGDLRACLGAAIEAPGQST